MTRRNHPPFYRETARILVAFIIRDVFADHSEMRNSRGPRSIFQLQTFKRFVRKIRLPSHVFGVGPRHAAEFPIPRQPRQSLFDTYLVGFFEGTSFDVCCFSY